MEVEEAHPLGNREDNWLIQMLVELPKVACFLVEEGGMVRLLVAGVEGSYHYSS